MENTRNVNPLDVRQLKDRLYHLKPAVVISDDTLTPELLRSVNRALNDEELIKIRTSGFDDYNDLVAIAQYICDKVEAVVVQIVGRIIAIYRKHLPPEVE